jgi:signal transduction histidine kinase
MTTIIQNLWDQMRADLSMDGMPQVVEAHQALVNLDLGPLTAQQIEDLEAMERSLDKLARRVEGEAIAWDDFSEAAHALRGPLNSIIGFSRLMVKGIEGPVTEEQQRALGEIYDTSRRMLALFGLLLNVLQLDDSSVDVIESVPADQVLEEMVAIGQVLQDNLGFGFETDLAPSALGATIQTDQGEVRQALSALMAVLGKYAQGQTTIRLRAWAQEAQLLVQMEGRDLALPSSWVDLPTLLTEDADDALPYDAHLRLGLAFRLLRRLSAKLEAERTGEKFTLVASLPLS